MSGAFKEDRFVAPWIESTPSFPRSKEKKRNHCAKQPVIRPIFTRFFQEKARSPDATLRAATCYD
jgi:hypothetical protein